MGEVSLELLQSMMQRLLDGQGLLRADIASIRRRLGRLEYAVVALQRSHVDRLEGEVGIQDQIDTLTRRMERFEERAS